MFTAHSDFPTVSHMSKRAADIDEGPDNKKARMLQTVVNTVPSDQGYISGESEISQKSGMSQQGVRYLIPQGGGEIARSRPALG